MKRLSKNARGFVDSLAKYITTGGEAVQDEIKAKKYLETISRQEGQDSVALVETAVDLSVGEERVIKDAVEKAVGHQVDIRKKVTPVLLGGLRITVGDWIFDDTLKLQLKNIQNMLS